MKSSVFKAGWPTYDEEAMKDDEIEVPVQINGKTRAVISIAAESSQRRSDYSRKRSNCRQTDRKYHQRDLCTEEDH